MKSCVVNIPMYNPMSGGIKRMLRLLQEMYLNDYTCHLHLDKPFLDRVTPKLPFSFSVGSYDNIPEQFAHCISYSDNPNIDKLCNRFENVLIYQLSYGMAIDRERKVVRHPQTIILCSTEKIKQEVETDTKKQIYVLGFALDDALKNFHYDPDVEKSSDICLLYHKAKFKNSELIIDIATKQNLTISVFGNCENLKDSRIHNAYHNPNIETLRHCYQSCKFFVSASEYEGLNMTPLEASLCGTPAIIIDGTNELYIEKQTALRTDLQHLSETISIMNKDYLKYYDTFKTNIKKLAKKHTWYKVIQNLNDWIKND